MGVGVGEEVTQGERDRVTIFSEGVGKLEGGGGGEEGEGVIAGGSSSLSPKLFSVVREGEGSEQVRG